MGWHGVSLADSESPVQKAMIRTFEVQKSRELVAKIDDANGTGWARFQHKVQQAATSKTLHVGLPMLCCKF